MCYGSLFARAKRGFFSMAQLLLEAMDIQVGFGTQTVLDISRFSLYDGDRVG